MSQYLIIGINVISEGKETSVDLLSFSRNTETYQAMYDCLHYTNDHKRLTAETMSEILTNFQVEVSQCKEHLNLLYTRAITIGKYDELDEETKKQYEESEDYNPVMEYLSFKDYYEEKAEALNNIQMISMMIGDAEYEDKIKEYYYWIG